MARVRFSHRLDGRLVAWVAAGTWLAAIAGLAWSGRLDATHGVAATALCALAGLIAVHDLRTYWIPDRYTASFALVAAATTFAHFGVVGLGRGLAIGAVAALGLAILAGAYQRVLGRSGFGRGDIKLIAASALLVAPAGLVVQLSLAGIAAYVFALQRAHRRGRPLARSTRVPLGMALAPAAVLAWSLGWTPII